MNTVLVWVLVTFGYNDVTSYSPPVSTLKECQQIAKAIESSYSQNRNPVCLHLRIVKS
jgi:hypothetical protein